MNPADFDWYAPWKDLNIDEHRAKWQTFCSLEDPEYAEEDLDKDSLQDDFQTLFVDIVLQHAAAIVRSQKTGHAVTPLRLLLLGTAGTGETTAVNTLLQELTRMQQRLEIAKYFYQVGAPTGTAAFNIRFGATSIHRLIHWLRINSFVKITNEDALDRLQQSFAEVRLLLSVWWGAR